MKRVCALFILVAVSATAFGDGFRVTVRADWMFTLRAGIEYRFGRYLGIKADIGTNFVQVAGDLCGVLYAIAPESPWQANLLFGVPNIGAPVTLDGVMVSPGVSVETGYRWTSGVGVDLRLGEGFPFFFEEGKDIIRPVSLAFGLWPDIALGVSFPL